MKRALLLLLFPLACAAEPASVTRQTELKKEPASDAAAVATLAEHAQVEALERKGGWTRVKTPGGAEGWVKMLVLRFGARDAAAQGDTGLSQLFNVARTGTSGTQVTTGVRGLDAEQLSTARANPAELRKMERFAVNAQSASRFAEGGHLAAKQVEYPEP